MFGFADRENKRRLANSVWVMFCYLWVQTAAIGKKLPPNKKLTTLVDEPKQELIQQDLIYFTTEKKTTKEGCLCALVLQFHCRETTCL